MERNSRFDILRILMSVLVVLLHVAADGCNVAISSPMPFLYNSMGRVAVPIFFMVTGAISLRRIDPVRKSFTRMISRILMPLLTASLLYLLYQGLFFGSNVMKGILLLPKQPAYYHLSFMYQMLGFYIAMPLLQGGWKTLSFTSRTWLALTMLIGDFLMKKGFVLSALPFPGYIAYTMAGALLVEWLETTQMPKRKRSWLVSFAFLIGYAALTYVTASIVRESSHRAGFLVETYWEYDSLTVVLAAICLFCAVCTFPLPPPGERFQRFLSRWNGLTLGIYLIHPLFLDMIQNGHISIGGKALSLSWDFCKPLFAIPLLTILYYALSAASMVIFQKISLFLKQK